MANPVSSSLGSSPPEESPKFMQNQTILPGSSVCRESGLVHPQPSIESEVSCDSRLTMDVKDSAACSSQVVSEIFLLTM